MQRFKPSNELSFDTVPLDCDRLKLQLSKTKAVGLCLDLSDVMQCDSAGLALLIEAKRICDQYRLMFEIEGMSKAMHALAEFCGINQVLAI